MFPQIVAEFRTSGSAMTAAVSTRIWYHCLTMAELSRSASRVRAPIRNAPSRSSTYASPGMRLMSTRTAGSANRSLSIGIKLWPPARILASPACAFSRVTASSIERGAR